MYITLLKKNIKISSIKKSATYNYLLYLLFIFLTISNIPANISRQVAITASSCQLVKSSNTLANIVRKKRKRINMRERFFSYVYQNIYPPQAAQLLLIA